MARVGVPNLGPSLSDIGNWGSEEFGRCLERETQPQHVVLLSTIGAYVAIALVIAAGSPQLEFGITLIEGLTSCRCSRARLNTGLHVRGNDFDFSVFLRSVWESSYI